VSQVNLLPSELRAREATRRLTSVVVIVGVIVLGLVGLFYFFQVMNLSRARDDLAAPGAKLVVLLRPASEDAHGQLRRPQGVGDLRADEAGSPGDQDHSAEKFFQ